MLAVGGTGAVIENNRIVREYAWNSGNGSATGGGVSTYFPLPTWQAAVKIQSLEKGPSGRQIPDVAALADPNRGYAIVVNGQAEVVGGTSASASLWAGLIALLNQGVGHNLGDLHERLYNEIGPALGVLNAITEGNNGDGNRPGHFAGPGWNAVAGWGTPDGQKLSDFLKK